MTPAEKPRDPARTRRDASFTMDGKKTTAAPSPVEAPAAITSPMATPAFSFVLDISSDILAINGYCRAVMSTIRIRFREGILSVACGYVPFVCILILPRVLLVVLDARWGDVSCRRDEKSSRTGSVPPKKKSNSSSRT